MADTTEKSRVSLPLLLFVATLTAAGSSGVTYGTLTARIAQLERESSVQSQRLTLVENAIGDLRPLLERIDERTETMKQQLERTTLVR